MIKILHFIPGFKFGGIETGFLNLFKKIDSNKYKLELAVENGLYDFDRINELKSIGCKVHVLPRFSLKRKKDYIRSLENLFSSDFTIDIVHSYNVTRSSFIFKIAKKFGIDNRIYHARTNKLDGNNFKKNILKLFLKYSIRLSTVLLANSQEAGDAFFNKRKYIIMNNGTDLKKYTYNASIRYKLRKDFDLENNFVIGHVGRFTEAKNHEFIINLFYEYQKINDKAILMLVGDGPLLESMREKVDTLKIEKRVIFTGSIEKTENYYQLIDFFVFPSLYEGFGNVSLEAQASGLTVLSSTEIPRSTKITKNVIFLSLDEPISKWIEAINKNRNNKRENLENTITNSKYDVSYNIQQHEKLYYNLVK